MQTRRIQRSFLFLVALLAFACGDNITPSGPEVESLALSQTTATTSIGMTVNVTLNARLDDGTTINVASQATWTSSNQAVATVAAGIITGVSAGTATITAAYGGKSASLALTVSAVPLRSIAISPGGSSTALGVTVPFTATGTFADGTNRDISNQVTWSATPTTVATIDATTGVATPVAVGTATITATSGTISATTTLRVTNAVPTRIEVTAADGVSIAAGTTAQLTATVIYSNNTTQNITSQVSWTSSAPTIATVSNEVLGSKGLVTGLIPGTTTITATLGTVEPILTATLAMTVTIGDLLSIAITPAAPSIPDGATQALVATGTYVGGTTQVITADVDWSTSDAAIATVDAAGVVTGVAVGTAQITATEGTVTQTITVTVTAATFRSVAISPPSPTVPDGGTIELTATALWTDGPRVIDTGLSWTSDNTAVATVTPGTEGRVAVRGESIGTAVITATYLLGTETFTATTTVTVTAAALVSIAIEPAAPSLAAGTSTNLTATATFSDGTTLDYTDIVVWASEDDTVVTVRNDDDHEGEIRGVRVGSTRVFARSGEGSTLVVGEVTVTVTAATLVSIAVTPDPARIAVNTNQIFVATGTFTDGSQQALTTDVVWTTSVPAVASVVVAADGRGVATGLTAGDTVIRAARGTIGDDVTLTVTSATLTGITIEPATLDLVTNQVVQLRAIGTFSDASTQDLTAIATWVSSNTATVGIGNSDADRGRVTTTAVPGTATITASVTVGASTQTADRIATVVQATLQSITVAPATASIVDGTTQQFVANGLFNNGQTVDVTATALWASSAAAVASVSNADGSKGLATGLSVGQTSITATVNAIVGTATLDVTPSALVSFVLTAPAGPVEVGATLPIVATGTFADGSTGPAAELLTWSSSDAAIARVSDTAGSRGLVTGVAVGGPVTITARRGDISQTVEVSVIPSTVTPARLIINEVDYDMVNTPGGMDDREFVEIVNAGGTAADLTGIKLVLGNSAATGGANSYLELDLGPAGPLAPGQILVVGSALVLGGLPAEVPNDPTSIKRIAFMGATDQLQNGPTDGVAIVRFVDTTCTQIDSLSYEGSLTSRIRGCGDGTFNFVEGTATTAVDAATAGSLIRTNRIDTNDAAADWTLSAAPTPGT